MGERNRRRIWLTKIRLEKELTQTELAKQCGVSVQMISNIELGRRQPSGPLAMKIARVLGFEMDKFYEDEHQTA